MRRGVERLLRDVAERLPLGPGGIVRGAEPIAFDAPPPATDRAALLLHGFGDAPDTLLGLAAHLNARGWTVRAPLLPGHGRTLAEFARTGADDWFDAARDAYATLRARHARVALVGQSMGGALGAVLAADVAAPASLVLLAPYVAMPRAVRALAALHPIVGVAAPWLRTRSDRSILDPAARAASRGYGVAAPRLLRELARVVDRAAAALPRVAVRTRVVASRNDIRVPPAAARAAFARLGAREKDLVWLDGCGHVITVDYDRERVDALVSEWIGRD